MSDIRVGIVGTGGFANWHAEQYAEIDGVELAACCDIDAARAEAFGDKHGFRAAVESAGEVFDSCDAVSIVTPESVHAELVLAALAAGRHVLCEKPLTVTLEEARQVAHAARASAGVHMINFSKRNAAAVQEAIRLSRSGALGAIRYAHVSYFQSWVPTSVWGHWTEPQWLWRLEKPERGAGGALTDIGSHMLDLASAVVGPIARLRCSLACMPKIHKREPVTSFKGRALDANDSAIIEIEPAEGGMGVVQLTRWATGVPNQERLELFGTEGGLTLDLADDPHVIQLCRGKHLDTCEWESLKLDPTPNTVRRFIDAIRAAHPGEPDLQRGAEVQAYLDACERSAASEAWVEPGGA